MPSRLSLALLLLAAAPIAAAAEDKSSQDMGTPEQRNACSHDVGRYCKTLKPEDGPFAYLDCLQKHHDKLRPACVKVIEGGGAAPDTTRP
jgi:hypothetical protein